MATAFPASSDPESGLNPRNYTKLGPTLLRARYRASVGDSNAAAKMLIVGQAAPSQPADLTGYYGSSKNHLIGFDAAGGLVQGSGNCSQRVVQVTLTAAQIIALHSAPVALVAAPGASKVVIPTLMTFQFK